MSREQNIKTLQSDLIEVFDEEVQHRCVVTSSNTAEKLTDLGYRKASDVVAEIQACFAMYFGTYTDITTTRVRTVFEVLSKIAEGMTSGDEDT